MIWPAAIDETSVPNYAPWHAPMLKVRNTVESSINKGATMIGNEPAQQLYLAHFVRLRRSNTK